jgi:DNA-binding protein HU-beta
MAAGAAQADRHNPAHGAGMNKAEMLEALQKQTKLRPTYVKRVVDAIFDPEDGVISKQVKRGGKVTIAGFGTFDRRNHKAREVNSVFTGRTVKVKARKIPGFRAGVSFKEAMR